MVDLIEKARQLAEDIAASPQAQAVKQAREKLNANPEAAKLYKEFQQHARKVAELEAANKPIEVEDKQKLRRLQEQLVANDEVKELTSAQVEYVDLMRQVNQALGAKLQELEA
jgi:cell fate (sporulation/competence/biofilm development) regulator YlbF (YheA/YmcA/DUF963 family)